MELKINSPRARPVFVNLFLNENNKYHIRHHTRSLVLALGLCDGVELVVHPRQPLGSVSRTLLGNAYFSPRAFALPRVELQVGTILPRHRGAETDSFDKAGLLKYHHP